MPKKIMLEGFAAKTLQHQAPGGRPSNDITHAIPEFVAIRVVKLYAKHLRDRAPEKWSDRQLNHTLFGDASSAPSRKDPVFNGLKQLRERRSIPRLIRGHAISDAILRAEQNPRFAGGLQILYHPYTVALAGKHDLPTLHSLLCLVPMALAAGFIKHTAAGIERTIRSPETEIDLVAAAASGWRTTEQWRHRFPDVMASALLLAQEAAAMTDHKRLKRWQRWFRRGELRFEDWPVGDKEDRKKLDLWVMLLLENLHGRSFDPLLNKFDYLGRHVFTADSAVASSGDRDKSPPKGSPYTLGDLAIVMTAIQIGTARQIP